MSRLPVIVGFGGYNAAGRSSFHHGFRRTVQESLQPQARQETLAGLAQMMKLVRVVDGKAEMLSVEVLATTATDALITGEGLAVGDTVVVRGNERVRPGQEVRVEEEGS